MTIDQLSACIARETRVSVQALANWEPNPDGKKDETAPSSLSHFAAPAAKPPEFTHFLRDFGWIYSISALQSRKSAQIHAIFRFDAQSATHC